MVTKIIQIYGMYLPPANEDGEGRVMFRFMCDGKTASMVESAMSGAKVRRDGECVVKSVKYSDVEKFVMGTKLFPKIIEAIQYYGSKEGVDYAFDESSRDSIIGQVKKQFDDRTTDETIKQVDASLNEYMDNLIKYIKDNINDPKFIEYLRSVGSVIVLNGDIFEKTKPSPKNAIMIMSQWVRSGHNGAPTILATSKQWNYYFKRSVETSATPLYFVRPFDITGRSVEDTMSEYGVTKNAYMSNAAVRKAVDQLAQDMEYGVLNNRDFKLCPMPYYDVSETIVHAGSEDILAKALKDIGAEEKESETKSDIDISPIVGKESNIDTLMANATAWAQKHDQELAQMIQNGADFKNVVNYLVMNSESVARKNVVRKGVDDAAKNLMVNLLKAFVYLRYGVMQEEAKKYVAHVASGGVTKQMMYSLNSDLSNIVAIFGGVNESYDGNLMRWMLGVMGMTEMDFERLPNSYEDIENNVSGVAEAFMRTLGKINEGRRITHGIA